MNSVFTVADLIDQFRSGLTALIPVAERAGIVWHGPHIYDPWETIEQALFKSLVVSVTEYACNGPFYPLAGYNVCHPDYTRLSFLTNRSTATLPTNLVFLDLLTVNLPFDVARFVKLDQLFTPVGNLVEIPLPQVTFAFAARTDAGVRYLSEIEFDG